MSEYPWKAKNNIFTWLNSLYNPFKLYVAMPDFFAIFTFFISVMPATIFQENI